MLDGRTWDEMPDGREHLRRFSRSATKRILVPVGISAAPGAGRERLRAGHPAPRALRVFVFRCPLLKARSQIV